MQAFPSPSAAHNRDRGAGMTGVQLLYRGIFFDMCCPCTAAGANVHCFEVLPDAPALRLCISYTIW